MTAFLWDLLIAFRAAREARRRMRSAEGWLHRGSVAQAARLALMSDTELLACASQWGNAICRRELLRRGLTHPNCPITNP